MTKTTKREYVALKAHPKHHAERAAKAHTTLCIFDSVIGILDRSNIVGISAQRSAQKIRDICHKQQRIELEIYDEEISHVK